MVFWLRLGPKLEKRGLRGVFLTFGDHVFCYSPLGAFCVFLSVPFSVIRSACSLEGEGGLNDVLFRGQPYAAIIKSTTTGNEHVTNETTAGGGRGRRHMHPPSGPTYERAKGSGNIIAKQPSPCKHHHQATITMQTSSPSNHHHANIITKQPSP